MMARMDSRDRDLVARDLRVLELLEAALERREEVIAIVDSSEDSDEAQERIRELLGVQEPHISRAVLDMQVSRWTRSGRKAVSDRVEELRRLLND